MFIYNSFITLFIFYIIKFKMSTTIITTFDVNNIDLNALFSCQISYNFDLLKQLMEALLKNQKGFEDRLNEKDKKIDL